jgi:ADP-ribose pyrophosphatase
MQPWKTLSRNTILDQGEFLTVENHVVELPDGTVLSNWAWLITPDYVNVMAITEERKFICFRQTKYAVEGTTLAPVGGYLDPGEDPLVGAKRELLEETGYEAQNWTFFGSFRVDGNRGAGTAHLFLARDAQQVAEPDADDLEEQQLILLTRAELESALAAGDLKVLAWAAVAALTLLHLKE